MQTGVVRADQLFGGLALPCGRSSAWRAGGRPFAARLSGVVTGFRRRTSASARACRGASRQNTGAAVVFIRGLWMFNKFDSIWLVTHGGPLKATETLPLYAYRLAFEEFDFGLAAAACSVMFVVLLVGAVVYFKLFDPTKEIEVGR
jgi:hypothetical protein